MNPKLQSSCFTISILLGITMMGVPRQVLGTDEHAEHKHDAHTSAEHQSDKPVGDPYTLSTCVVTGEKLGTDAVVYDYHGRELRFGSKNCISEFEKQPDRFLEGIDRLLIEQQKPYYTLETCPVSGDPLGGAMGDPIDLIYRNRLIRFCCKSCIKQLESDPDQYWSALDRKIADSQREAYPLNVCPVTGNKLDGSMGEPLETVIGNRLVRLCCANCKKAIELNPAPFLEKVDAAWKGHLPIGGSRDVKHTEVHPTSEHQDHKH